MNNPSFSPIIGINVENKPACNGVSEFDYISHDYVDAIVSAGGIPLLLPPVDKLELIPKLIDRVDGVLFIGGPDLNPNNDHYKIHRSVRMMSARRENFDRALMKEIAKRRIPVMGVGVGLQLLNVSQGGSLFYHIPEDLPRALLHRDLQSDYSLRHRLIVEKGSLLASVYGDNDVRVNSRHHMAIDDVASGFVVTARCPGLADMKASSDDEARSGDSVIEAIESCMEDWFAFGVQFHPEAKHSATALDLKIFEKFIEGVVVSKETGRNMLASKPHSKETNRKKSRKTKSSESIVNVYDNV